MKYTEKEEAFFIEFIPGHTVHEIRKEFVKRFNKDITINQIRYYKQSRKIKSKLDMRFKKGRVAVNKGKKMKPEVYAKVARTMFKVGHIPSNHRPVGSERINVYGYIEVKISEPNVWKPKHRWLWEKHNGKIPKSTVLIFKDNDKLNVCLDNLILISRAENAEINRYGDCKFIGQAKEAIVNLARLKYATKNAKEKRKK